MTNGCCATTSTGRSASPRRWNRSPCAAEKRPSRGVLCTALCGRLMAPESAATHRLSSSAGICHTSSNSASPTKCTKQKRPTRRREMHSARSRAAVDKMIVLTGTLTGGMASDVFNVLYRIDPRRMVSQGYEYGDAGIRSFTETYGVLETITTIEPQENACSKAKITRRVKERPGASPLLFARFLMDIGAFVSLEDISANLPPYTEEVVSVPMDKPLAEAYARPGAGHRGGPSGTPREFVGDQHGPECAVAVSRPAVFDWTALGRCLRRRDQTARTILDCGPTRSR